MTLLAIDPGRAVKPSIGWALFATERTRYRELGSLIEKGEMNWRGLAFFLRYDPEDGFLWFNGYDISQVVIENFVNDPGTRRGGQPNGASEVIGAVEILATQANVPFLRQPRTILPVAKLQAGYVDTHKHLPHQDAAYLHGYHYLVGQGVLQEKGLSGTLG